jgi:hypothetical protein
MKLPRLDALKQGRKFGATAITNLDKIYSSHNTVMQHGYNPRSARIAYEGITDALPDLTAYAALQYLARHRARVGNADGSRIVPLEQPGPCTDRHPRDVYGLYDWYGEFPFNGRWRFTPAEVPA